MIRALVVIAALASIAEAKRVCFTGPMRPQIVAGPNAKIAGSGGVVVASGTTLPDWRFRDLNRIVRPRIITIAPGLAIYHPPPLAGTDVILENDAHDVIDRTERALTIDPTAAAPRINSITKLVYEGSRRAVMTDLADSVPEHVLVVIVSRVAGETLVPLTWVRVSRGQLAGLLVWRTPGGCEQTIESAVEPKLGDKIVLSWVDDAGRVSEPSNPLTIVAAKPRPSSP